MSTQPGCRSARRTPGTPGVRHPTTTATRHAALRLAAGVALLVGLAGCGSAPADPGAASSDAPRGAGQVTVLAAASLTKPLTSLAEAYEKARPGTAVEVSFGSSTTLAQQISQGADADL
ncbi:MAG: molybdate ABC transporter substrate-binding protein, partial [Phycicoccus sp.]